MLPGMQGFCVWALNPYRSLFFCLVNMWYIRKFHCNIASLFVQNSVKTEKLNKDIYVYIIYNSPCLLPCVLSVPRRAVWVWGWGTSSVTRAGSWSGAVTHSPNRWPNRPAPCRPAPPSRQVTHIHAHTHILVFVVMSGLLCGSCWKNWKKWVKVLEWT